MRLIDARTLELVEVLGPSNHPYAILSHTWEDGEEVSFQEFRAWKIAGGEKSDPVTSKTGFAKIVQTCALALSAGLQYAWVDTCCIDKSSSAELTESINSMYQWYSRADICYAYFSDYKGEVTGGVDDDGSEDKLSSIDAHVGPSRAPSGDYPSYKLLADCRWFKRGWTLQELVAPQKVQFYDQEWKDIGTKQDLASDLSRITSIPEAVIRGASSSLEYSVAQRMSWASQRTTTRTEDEAYCLLGLFDIYMPMVYGEGNRAFRRLQEEILKRSPDLTILAWKPYENTISGVCDVFATSPRDFRDSKDIIWGKWLNVHFTVTSLGLRISRKRMRVGSYKLLESVRRLNMMQIGMREAIGDKEESHVYIPLQMNGYGTYMRIPELVSVSWSVSEAWAVTSLQTFYIEPLRPVLIGESTMRIVPPFRSGILMPRGDRGIRLDVGSTFPPEAYDHTNGVCYRPQGTRDNLVAFSFDVTVGSSSISIGLLLAHRIPERLTIVDKSSFEGRLLFLLLGRSTDVAVNWTHLQQEMPDILRNGSKLRLANGPRAYEIRAELSSRETPLDGVPVMMKVLNLVTEDLGPVAR